MATRSKESILKAQETRKRNAALAAAEASDAPTIPQHCLCGCGEGLPTKNKPSQRREWKQGHDARGKKILRAVLRGEEAESTIPREMVIYRAKIKFLNKIEETNEAGENAKKLLDRMAAQKVKKATS